MNRELTITNTDEWRRTREDSFFETLDELDRILYIANGRVVVLGDEWVSGIKDC